MKSQYLSEQLQQIQSMTDELYTPPDTPACYVISSTEFNQAAGYIADAVLMIGLGFFVFGILLAAFYLYRPKPNIPKLDIQQRYVIAKVFSDPDFHRAILRSLAFKSIISGKSKC